MAQFTLKAAQLDLARQMETIPFIRQFIDLLADNGYNALMLYLEDRVRTDSYPYPPEGEAYTEEEIRSLVQYGSSKGIELFPCVATLGHAERFLRHPELAGLSEVRDGMHDRFGDPSGKNVFCITNPDFYPFIEKYITEVAALFPSVWFHAGLDEFFNFNLCERCRKKMPLPADEEKAFLEHIVRIREILRKLGKRMMMWSDMFEFYPSVLPEVPKDVVMVDWQYQTDVRFYHGHLLDQGVEDRLAFNEKLGFETVLAPADRPLDNAPSYLHYAEKRKALGFMVTSWEKNDTFLYRSFPLFCYTGRLLRGEDGEQAFSGAIQYLFGSSDPVLIQTFRMAASAGYLRHFEEISDTALFARPFMGLNLPAVELNLSLIALMEHCKGLIRTEVGQAVWKDTMNALQEKAVGNDFKQIFQDAFDLGYAPELTAKAEKVLDRFLELMDDMSKDWDRFRPGISGNVFKARKPELEKRLRDRIRQLALPSLIRTRYCMPDQYGVSRVKILVKAGGKWQEAVVRGGFKADSTEDAVFEYTTSFAFEGTPEAIRYEITGMGGRGIAFTEVRDQQGRKYFPCAIAAVEGIVEHPEFLLDNDVNFAWFGGQSTRIAYNSKEVASVKHCVTLLLKTDQASSPSN